MVNYPRKLTLVIFGSFISQISQVSVFPIFLAQYLSELNLKVALIGWFLGLQWVVVLVCAPIVPRLCASIGLSNTVKLSIFVTVAGLILLFLQSLIVAFLASILVGLGLVLRWVTCDTLVIAMSDKDKIGRMIGLHETLMGLGIAVGPLLFVWLDLKGVNTAAIILMLISAIAFLLLGKTNLENQGEKSEGLKFKAFNVIGIALMLALIGGFIETASVSLFPFYFEISGFSLETSALFVSAFGFGGTLLQLPLGALVDKLGYSRVQMLSCITALAGLAALYLTPTEFVSLYVILFFFGGAVGAFNTLAVIQAGSVVSIKHSSTAMAYIAMFYTIGSIIGPIIVSGILQNMQTGFVLALYCGIILLAVFVISKNGM